jgi:hypothetical protein
MKSAAEMSDAELNEAIALMLGYEHRNVNVSDDPNNVDMFKLWCRDEPLYQSVKCPDFTHKWQYAGLLLEEIGENIVYIGKTHERGWAISGDVIVDNDNTIIRVYGKDSPTRAIAEAFYTLKAKNNDHKIV